MNPQTPKLGLMASKYLMSSRKRQRNKKPTDPILQVETDDDLQVKSKRRKRIRLTDDLTNFNLSAVSHVAPENLELDTISKRKFTLAKRLLPQRDTIDGNNIVPINEGRVAQSNECAALISPIPQRISETLPTPPLKKQRGSEDFKENCNSMTNTATSASKRCSLRTSTLRKSLKSRATNLTKNSKHLNLNRSDFKSLPMGNASSISSDEKITSVKPRKSVTFNISFPNSPPNTSGKSQAESSFTTCFSSSSATPLKLLDVNSTYFSTPSQEIDERRKSYTLDNSVNDVFQLKSASMRNLLIDGLEYTSTPFNKNSTDNLLFFRSFNGINLQTPMKANPFLSTTLALDPPTFGTAMWNVNPISLTERSNNDLDSTSLQKSTIVSEKSDYVESTTPLVTTSNCSSVQDSTIANFFNSKRMSDETFIAGNKFFPNNTKNNSNYLSVLDESVDSFKELSTSANISYLSVNVDDDTRRQSYITESTVNNITLLKSATKNNSKHKSKRSVPFSMRLFQSELEESRASDVVPLKPDQESKGLAQEPVRLGTPMMTREAKRSYNLNKSVNDVSILKSAEVEQCENPTSCLVEYESDDSGNSYVLDQTVNDATMLKAAELSQQNLGKHLKNATITFTSRNSGLNKSSQSRKLETTLRNTSIITINDSPEDILFPTRYSQKSDNRRKYSIIEIDSKTDESRDLFSPSRSDEDQSYFTITPRSTVDLTEDSPLVDPLLKNQKQKENKINFPNISGVTEIGSTSNTGAIRKTYAVSAKNKNKQDSVCKDLSNAATKTSSQKKVPNFALIHARAQQRLEGLDEYVQRKNDRARILLSGKKVETPKNTANNVVDAKKQLPLLDQAGQQNRLQGFTKYGFKISKPSREELHTLAQKTRVPVDRKGGQRNLIKGVRSNRRFDLLMKHRQEL